jgi:hypothetical protein
MFELSLLVKCETGPSPLLLKILCTVVTLSFSTEPPVLEARYFFVPEDPAA